MRSLMPNTSGISDDTRMILKPSEMPEVLGMSDRIIVMHEGHLR
ncbi:hypothetical protein PSY51_23965, partial [Shigella flexneri]|nr:hypothetical protein [Shigella flexneri]